MTDQFYIDKRDNTATPRLRDKGAPVTLRSKTGGTFNANTGGTTAGGVSDITTKALLKSYKLGDVDGSLILRDDRFCLMAAVSDSGVALNPTPEMQLIAQGVTYRIVHVEPLAPGGIPILFRLQLRV